ncbi:peptidase inhibitor family I36 protein [Polyangium aurulentum]|uniref:peptidase inhibitor family I36 protein n=1 Tax=Polyangium aurulentum TaxID=2567896 RepID=UPI00146AAA53|nr:peptidase inhibitor family I36 protein [Polyangium aurulentum]UQA54806.1 peptidase inhibitor family I36 protein [Polyangium aurulentum]
MMRAKFALVVGLVAAAPLVGEGAALADARDCPRGHVCLWQHVNYRGRMLKFSRSEGWVNLGGAMGFNDQVSSWCNNTGRDAQLSFHTNGGGRTTCLQNNTCSTRVSGDWNDEASSVRITNSARACR